MQLDSKRGATPQSTGTLAVAALLLAYAGLDAPSAWAVPDLELTVVANQVSGTTKVNFQITVKNTSTTEAVLPSACGPIDLFAFPDNPTLPDPSGSVPTALQLDPWNGLAIPPSDSYSTVWTQDYGKAATFHPWVLLDTWSFTQYAASCKVVESSKANNQWTTTLVVAPPPEKKADLTISKLSAQVIGSSVTYVATVQNLGDADVATPFHVDVRFDSVGCPPADWGPPATKPLGYGNVFASVDALAKGSTKDVLIQNAKPGAGDHTSCAVVDLDGVIVESTKANNFAGAPSFKVTDVPTKSADLVVTALDIKVEGSTVLYTATVKNQGDVASIPVGLDLYFNSLTAPVANQAGDVVLDVKPIAPGDTWVGAEQRLGAKDGVYKAWAFVDRQKSGVDAKPENNVLGPIGYTVSVGTPRPDLVITEVAWSLSKDGSSVHYDITIKNQGTADAKDVDIDVFYDWAASPDCTNPAEGLASAPHGYAKVASLPAGAAPVTLAFDWVGAPPGVHKAWVKLDCVLLIDEIDETNNDKGPYVVDVKPPPTEGCNLKITDFKSSVTCTRVAYSATFTNVGIGKCGKFQVDLYYDRANVPTPGSGGGDLTFVYADGLGPSETFNLDTKHDTAESQKYTSWIVLDSLLDLTETDEGDNVAFLSEIVVDSSACICPTNSKITKACACGDETFLEGYCCNGQFSLDPFATCSDVTGDAAPEGQGGDLRADATGAEAPKVDPELLGTGGITLKSKGSVVTEVKGGCQSGTRTPATGAVLLLALLAIALSVRSARRRLVRAR